MRIQVCKHCGKEYMDFPSHKSKYCCQSCYHEDRLHVQNNGIKKCSKCGNAKPITEFSSDKYSKDGLRGYCNTCARIMVKEWQSKNKDHIAKYKRESDKTFSWNLKTKYGITPEEYQNIFDRQNGECAICHEKKKLFVDHDHVTNKVRGLLCNTCNSSIGLAKDSPVIAKAAMNYLIENNARGINWKVFGIEVANA